MFFDQLNFEKFIAPISFATFFSAYFDQNTLVLKRHNPDFYDGLLSPQKLDDVLFHWPNDATLVKADQYDGVRQNLGATVSQHNTPTILSELDKGSTLILDRLDQRIDSITRMCGIFENELHYPFQANVYITPQQSQGFKAHFDDHHVFILQTTGSKLWRIDKSAKPRTTPEDKALDFAIDEDNHSTVLLEQGDMLYIPPFTVHEAQGQDVYSIHITLSPYPPNWSQLLISAIKDYAHDLSSLAAPLPPKLLNDNIQLGDTLSDLFGQLQSANLNAACSTFKNRFSNNFRGAFQGALLNRVESSDISLTARYQLNQNIVIIRRITQNQITLQTAQKTSEFPLLFKAQIDFCLSGDTFIGESIPSMSHEEQGILLKRLATEGLIKLISA